MKNKIGGVQAVLIWFCNYASADHNSDADPRNKNIDTKLPTRNFKLLIFLSFSYMFQIMEKCSTSSYAQYLR